MMTCPLLNLGDTEVKRLFRLSDRLFRKSFKTSSIQTTIRASYVIIIMLLIIPPVISLVSSWFQTLQYDRIITNVSRTNRLNQIVKTDISNEVWDIVAGNKDFTEGTQYDIIENINSNLDGIFQNTQLIENRQMLEIAGRAMDTLTKYVDMLGMQMENEYPVTENEKILDEIRGVADLVSEILQDFIVLEIESAALTNEHIKRIAVILSVIQILVVLFVMLFAVLAQRSVTRSINKPIRELENLSSQIAAGNLSARADIPDVMELDNLTLNLNIMAEKIKELIDTNIQEQKNRQKSEMKALQAQITPHFLYNTLDTIIWLAEGKQYDQVISVTRNFASFFRTSLNKGNEWTTVQNELEHVRNYLAIQKIRYRDILEFSIICDDAMGDKQMLKLLLQPLVENALYHGIKNKRGRGRLSVRGWQEDGFLCFSVDDDGIGVSLERLKDIKAQLGCEPSNSAVTDIYGLYNVNRRLALYYNNKASMEISSMYKQGTSVSFRLPEIANV